MKHQNTVSKETAYFAKYVNQNPYSFTMNYCSICLENNKPILDVLKQKALLRNEGMEKIIENPKIPFDIVFPYVLKNQISETSNSDLKLVEISKDLIPLIEHTDNEVYDRPLFYKSIFINNDFHFKDVLIKGIYLTQCQVDKNERQNFCLEHPNPNAIAIFSIYTIKKLKGELFSSFVYNANFKSKKYEAIVPLTTKEESLIQEIETHIRTIVSNVLDMVENQEHELVMQERHTSLVQNKKRISRHKTPLPETTILIKPGKELSKYASIFNSHINSPYSHKFIVRGHYRLYKSNRYTNMKGKTNWIKPFIKGKGILINKKVKIE